MADALGIIGVIGVAAHIIHVIAQFGLDWKDAPDDAKAFMAEIQSLKTVLSEVNTNLLINEDFKNAFHGQPSSLLAQLGGGVQDTSLAQMVSACHKQMDDFLADLTKRCQGQRAGWGRLKGAFLSKKTREAVVSLQRQCQILNSLMSVDSLALSVRTHREVADAREEQRVWWTETKSKEILDWLTPIDYGPQQSDFFRRRQDGTGQWLLDSTQYQEWIVAKRRTIFCPGIPGAGKTIITSIVIDDLETRFQSDGDIAIAYFYFNFKNQDNQKFENALASLLKQLSQRRPCLPEGVRSLFEQHKNGKRPSAGELSKALRTITPLYSKVFIAIDALDECRTDDGSRSRFLTDIMDLQNISETNIFTTSRFIQEVTETFSQSTTLEIRARPEDVRRYVNGNILRLPKFVGRSPELQEEVAAKITQAVDGMFLLAQLYLDSLVGKRSIKAIRMALDTLHTGSEAYDYAYDNAMERIHSQIPDREELAKQVLSWITCAKTPLYTDELQHALAVEVGQRVLDSDNMSEIEDIVSVCAGLVTVDEESGVIRLVHFTTQEYFRRTWRTWFPRAQDEITDICATYLTFRVFETGPCDTDAQLQSRLQSYALYDYAARYWGYHAREVESTSRTVKHLLETTHAIGALVQVLRSSEFRGPGYSQKFPQKVTGLHLTAHFGIQKASDHLLETGCAVDAEDSDGCTPLAWAACSGCNAIVKTLLSKDGANGNAASRNGSTPIHWAILYHRVSTIETLVSSGNIDVNWKDIKGQTPLHKATFANNEAIFQMLLNTTNIDINSKDIFGETVLHLAVFIRNKAIVQMLLNTINVDVNSKARLGDTALHRAVFTGNETILQMLLNMTNIDVNLKTAFGDTALYQAISTGNEAIAQTLLNTTNINVNSKNKFGDTALHCAAEKGHEAILQMLLDTGKVNTALINSISLTALMRAVMKGTANTVQILLDIGKADVNAATIYGATAVSLAMKRGDEAIIGILHAAGARAVETLSMHP